MASEHGKPGCTTKKSFICSMCDKILGSKTALIRHMRAHTGERPFKCTVDECGQAFAVESTLKDHIKGKHSDKRSFECRFPGCQYAGKMAAALARHKKVHSDEKSFACSECDYRTNRNYHLKSHIVHHHSSRRDFKCSHPECTKSFKSSAELKLHFSNLHEERNLKCNHSGCGSNFANAKALNKHRRDVHSTKTLLCRVLNCSYSTIRSSKLARHMIVHDRRNRKITCSIEGCQYKGKNSQAMEDHLRRHKTLITCPESGCGYFAPTKEALNNHLKLHSSSGRPFKCPLCSKYFTTLHQLQDHCFAHTNERPFACGHCDYGAPFRADVKRHISSSHANVKFPFIVHLPDDRECVNCKVILPTAQFLLHCEGHVDPVVMEA